MPKTSKFNQNSSTQKNGNHKLTDYFSRGSNEPSSSQSQPSQGQARHVAGKFGTSVIKQEQAKFAPTMTSSPARAPNSKKENEPPRVDQEVISISSRSDTPSHITISSDSSVISISSTFSSPLPVPIAVIDSSAQTDANQISTFGRSASTAIELRSQSPPPPPRRSPRLRSALEDQSQQNMMEQPRKAIVKKAIYPAAVQPGSNTSLKGRKRKANEDEEFSSTGTAPSKVTDVKMEGRSGFHLPASQPVTPAKAKTSLKKAKLECNSTDDLEMTGIVPSSQSDERELFAVKRSHKDHDQVKQSVEAWQRNSSRCTSESSRPTIDSQTDVDADLGMNVDVGEDKEEDTSSFIPDGCNFSDSMDAKDGMPMKMEEDFNTPPSTPLSSLTSLSTRPGTPLLSNKYSPLKVGRTPLVTPKQTLPPASSSPKMPSSASSVTRVSTPPPIKVATADSPKVLDENAKTQQIIERIKRNAYAAVQSSPVDEDKSYGEFKELSDASDSEDDFKLNLRPIKVDKGKGKSVDTSMLSDHESSTLTEESEVQQKPYGLRSRARRSPSSRTSRSTRDVGNGIQFSFNKSRGGKAAPKQKQKGADLLDNLIKEKDKEKAKGISSFSLIFDESTRAAQEFANNLGMSSPSASGSSDDGDLTNVIGESDRKRLLGSPGHTLDRIIRSDQMRSSNEDAESKLGVPMWICEEASGSTDAIVALSGSCNVPILKLLSTYSVNKDALGINTVLQSGLLASTSVNITPELITWLLNFITANHPILSRSAFKALLDCSFSRFTATIPFQLFQDTLLRLSMRSDIMELLECPVSAHSHVILEPCERSEVLVRLVAVIESFARAKKLASDEVPLFIATLLCIFIDPDSTLNLRNKVACTVEALYTCLHTLGETRSAEEIKTCQTVLKLTSILTPGDKYLLVSCLVGGSTVGLRVAQWVAYGLLTGHTVDDDATLVPRLSDVISLLAYQSLDGDPSGLFEICRDHETGADITDYSALSFHVDILVTVLKNIAIYTRNEKEEKNVLENGQSDSSASDLSTSSSSDSLSSTPSRKKQSKSYLEIIMELLGKLSNGIVDTKASHPERSKVKASLQHLKLRVHYQRQSNTNSSTGKSENIEKFLKPKPRPTQRQESPSPSR